MTDTSQVTAPLSASPKPLQALQRALLESARQLSAEASRFARQWQGAWPDPAAAGDLDACIETLRMVLDRLVVEFGKADGPGETEAAGLIGTLLGTTTEPGPLTLLQVLTQYDDASASLEEQKLLGEVDVLRIQLNALRSQWQDYLSLSTSLHRASGPQPVLPPAPLEEADALPFLPLPPNSRAVPQGYEAAGGDDLPLVLPFAGTRAGRRRTDDFFSPPAPPRAGPGESAWRGARGTFATFATLGAVLVVIIGIAYLAVTRLPAASQTPAALQTPASAPAQSSTAPPPAATNTSAPNPTATPQPLPTETPAPPPTNTPAPPPTATPPAAPGASQLAINPAVLLVPCPGTGAGTLQLVNTGAQQLNWQASAQSNAGGNPGIALDVSQGHLEVNGVALINVTALVQGAQGTISISYSGAATPTTVTYSVSC